MCGLTHLGSKITIEERRIRMWLSKEALKKLSLSEWTYFMEVLDIVQESIFTNAYSLIIVKPFQN